jgi:hypothetical protein
MANQAPVADAGPDQTVALGNPVTLDGSGSYDPDGLIDIGTNILVNDASGSQWQTPPSIGVDSTGEIHVLWEDYRTGGFDVYASHMASNGSSFATNVKVNDDVNPNRQSRPEMATGPGDMVHAVWEDYRNNNWDIYYANSTDGGLSSHTAWTMSPGPVAISGLDCLFGFTSSLTLTVVAKDDPLLAM